MAITLKVLISLSGTNGEAPRAGLIADGNGDLFGTTFEGGASGEGTVFEIANTATGYASTPTTLVSFNGTTGAYPAAGLIADANGDLFGTTEGGSGASANGTIFEIANTATGYASTPTTLATFNYDDGFLPVAGLIANANGDLFGTTEEGGASGDGTVFEIAKTAAGYASTPITVVTFNGTNGKAPHSGLIADANGDLFGTTESGGASGAGTVFEIANTATGYASTPITLAAFNYFNAFPVGGLIADSKGDLFGTTEEGGGANGYGTVFEIANTATGYASAPTTLAVFNYDDGFLPVAGLIADANGDLFGTTEEGGSGDGTVFEIANTATGYANTPITLAAFNYFTNGGSPVAGLIADASGDLFGTTESGGASGDGTVFEITNSGFAMFGPVITGTDANQTVNDNATTDPFAQVTVTDSNVSRNETVFIRIINLANGTLFDPNAATDGSTISNSVYAVTGSASAVTADLDALVFQPTAHQVAAGQTVTTGSTITVTDTVGETATDSTTSVITTAVGLSPVNTLVSFNGTDGASPEGGLFADANGDLFGATAFSGPLGYGGLPEGDGTIFEIVNTGTGYAATPSTLITFNGADGAQPDGSLIADTNGDLFGTAEDGGPSDDGLVFEVVKNGTSYSPSPAVLASFNGTDGSSPDAGLITDANGDLFGTTDGGGTDGDGTVFEVTKTGTAYASTPIALVSFNGADGSEPDGALIADSNGDLFGTTVNGGANDDGEIFEILKIGTSYASTPTAIASFDGTDGAYPDGSLTLDAEGDLFGTSEGDGADNGGSVFEVKNTATGYAAVPTVLATFDGADGSNLTGNVTADAAGNLFGAAEFSGSLGSTSGGTVFEIENTSSGYSTTPNVLATFDGANGEFPNGDLITDALGDLLGTTQGGGSATSGYGTAFEIADSGFVGAVTQEGNTITAAPSNGQTVSLNQVVDNPSIVPTGTIQAFVLDGPGTVSASGSVSIVNLEISGGELSLFGATVITDPVTVDANGNISGYGTVTGAVTNVGTITANGGTLELTGSVAGVGTLAVDPGAELLLDQGASAGAVSVMGGSLAVAGALNVGQASLGVLLVESQGTVTTGENAINGEQGLVIAASGGSGDAVVTGDLSLLSNMGSFIVGGAGVGSLSIESGGAVATNPGPTGLPGAVVGATPGASGSSVDVTGTDSNWQVGGTLVVGDAASGALDISAGGSVTAASIDAAAQANSAGVITVADQGSTLTTTGSLTIGNNGAGELSILNGASVIVGGDLQVGQSATGSGNVDIENASLTVDGNLDLGLGGNAGVLTVGTGGFLQVTGGEIGGADSELNEFGDPTSTFDDGVNTTVGVSQTQTYTAYIDDFASFAIKNGVTLELDTPSIFNNVTLTLGGAFTRGQSPVATELVLNAGSVDNTSTIAFGNALGTLVLGTDTLGTIDIQSSDTAAATLVANPDLGVPTIAQFQATIDGFKAGDQIVVDTVGTATFSQSGSIIDVVQNGTTIGALTFDTAANAQAAITNDALQDTAVCFCAGTLIRTPEGEVPVERLAVGDRVLTLRGEARPIVWIGVGRVLATRGRRNAATPVIVRKGALGANVPHRDLRVTKGHSVFVDGVLIPVEFLVNHRSVLWDDRAQEVSIYHVELATHDVLIANGAPAESYRDDGNRWLFRNGNAGWALAPQPPCAPVLTGGAVVDAVWRRLLERAGPRRGGPLTDDPDLHLVVDGRRVDCTARHGTAHVCTLADAPSTLRIVSRAAAPAELGLARDPRVLGVAVQRIELRQGWRLRVIEAADPALTDGFHAFEPDNLFRWTNGDAPLPAALFVDFIGPMQLVLHLGCTTQYLDFGTAVRAA